MTRGRKSKEHRTRQRDTRLRNPGRPTVAPHASGRSIEEAVPMVADLRRMLHSSNPLDILFFASSVMAAFEDQGADGPDGGDRVLEVDDESMTVPSVGEFVEALIGADIAESTALLHIVAMLTPDELLRQRIRRVLPQRRQPMPRVVAELDQAVVGDFAIEMSDPAGLTTNVVFDVTFAGGATKVFTVLVAHYLGDAVKDAFPDEGGVRDFLDRLDDHPETSRLTVVRLSPAEVRARIEPGLIPAADDAEDVPETATWPQLRPLIRWLLALMPKGGEGFEGGDEGPESRGADFARAAIRGFADGPLRVAGPGVGDLPESPAETPLLRLRIELDHMRPQIWRRVDVRGDLALDTLHLVIQEAMGWADMHLHRFSLDPGVYGGRSFLTDYEVAEGEEGLYEGLVSVDQVLREPGDELYYVYDFGDDWIHTIRVEQGRPCPEDAPAAVCLAGERAAPPEDCGGLPGFGLLLEQFAQGLTEGEEWESLPPGYDPAQFDIDETNLGLTALGTDAGEIEAPADGRSALHPAFQSLFQRLPMKDVVELTSMMALVDRAEASLSDEEVSARLRDWRFMLDLAADGGIELTAAGWMKPAVVESIFTGLGYDQWWIGKGNREDLTYPVFALREKVLRVGLLRKYKGRLVLTPAARELAHDRSLWRYLAERVFHKVDVDSVQAHASILLLLHTYAASSAGERPVGIADMLTRAGWGRRDGSRVDAGDVSALSAAANDLIEEVTSVRGEPAEDPRFRRAFAMEALRLPGPPSGPEVEGRSGPTSVRGELPLHET